MSLLINRTVCSFRILQLRLSFRPVHQRPELIKNVEEQLTEILTADGHKETFAIREEE